MAELAFFPRPESLQDIIPCDEEEPLSRTSYYALLLDPSAEEWRDKVDRTSPTRLLLSRDWVFKTRAEKKSDCFDTVRSGIERSVARTRRYRVWHPLKRWFILRAGGAYWPCNATPRLLTLRELDGQLARRLWLRSAVPLMMRAFLAHRIALDLNPSNFALEPSTEDLFYVDDEVYYSDSIINLLLKRREVQT